MSSIIKNMESGSNIGKISHLLRKGDIVACRLGLGEGSEQAGTRPCIIISNNMGNKYGPTLLVAPITSSYNKGKLPTHIEIRKTFGLEKDSVVLCEQSRVVDKSRVMKFLGSVSVELIEKINNALTTAFEIQKRGEQQAKDCVIRIKCYEEMMINMFNFHGSTCAINEMVSTYKKNLNELEKICNNNWLNIDDYYIQSEGTKDFLNLIDTKVIRSLRVI
jgi:mRNA interferase MazF